FFSEPEEAPAREKAPRGSRRAGAKTDDDCEERAAACAPAPSFSLASLESLQRADVFSMGATFVEIFTAEASGRQQHVVDLPFLLQLRSALLQQRTPQLQEVSVRGAVRPRQRESEAASAGASTRAARDASGARDADSARPSGCRHEEEAGEGERQLSHGQRGDSQAEASPVQAVEERSEGDARRRGRSRGSRSPARSASSGLGRVAPPPAVKRALQSIESSRVRRALEEILLRQPEERRTALECLEGWGSPGSSSAFFPPAFFSCFFPLFTVLTHPSYQQPDARLLLIRRFLPHFVAATLQRRRSRGGLRNASGSAAARERRRRGIEEERRVLQVLDAAVDQLVVRVDPQVMFQSILHGALTSPNCTAVATLVSAWSSSRRREALAGSAAAASVLGTAYRDPSEVLSAPPSRVSLSAPSLAAAAGGVRPSLDGLEGAPLGDAASPPAQRKGGGVQAREAAREAEAAATGAAAAVGGFSEVPHPDLSLDSARRFSTKLLALWKKSRALAVEKRLAAADVARELEADRRALYDGLFLPAEAGAPSSVASLFEEEERLFAGSAGDGERASRASARGEVEGEEAQEDEVEAGSGVASVCSASHTSPFLAASRDEFAFLASFYDPELVSYPSLAALFQAAAWGGAPGASSPAAVSLRRGTAAILAELIGSTLQHCNSPHVRACGVSMLAFLARFSSLHGLLKCVLPYLLRALDDAVPAVRIAALRALPAALSQIYLPRDSASAGGQCTRATPEPGRREPGSRPCARPAGAGDEEDRRRERRQASADAAREKKVSFASRDAAGRARRERDSDDSQREEEGYAIDASSEDNEAEGDAFDDRAAARGLAGGSFDFLLFFCQTVLPRAQQLATGDGEISVRLAVAGELPRLLVAMRHCLELQSAAQATAFVLARGAASAAPPPHDFEETRAPSVVLLRDARVQQLRAAVKPVLQQLLTSRQPAERLALLESVNVLAEFLGPEETQQFLLPYLIMQVNDPLAPSIRAAVALAFGRVGLQLGGTRGTVETCILPCCEQALIDAREEVLLAALHALQLLASAGLLAAVSSSRRDAGATGAAAGGRRGGVGVLSPLSLTLGLLQSRVLPLLAMPAAAVRGEVLHLLRRLEAAWGRAASFALLLPLLEPFTKSRGAEPTAAGGAVPEGAHAGREAAAEAPPRLLLSVGDLPRVLRPPLARAVYVRLLEPRFRGAFAALAAAVAAADRGEFEADALAQLVFHGDDARASRPRPAQGARAAAGLPSVGDVRGAGGRSAKAESSEAASRCSSTSDADSGPDTDDEEADEDPPAARMQRLFADFEGWCGRPQQPASPSPSPACWTDLVVRFLVFARARFSSSSSSDSFRLPSSPRARALSSAAAEAELGGRALCRAQLEALGLLLGLRPADRRALLLLLPYLRSVDRAAPPAGFSLAALPCLSPVCLSKPSAARGDAQAHILRALSGVDQLDEALPAGEPLTLVEDESDGGEAEETGGEEVAAGDREPARAPRAGPTVCPCSRPPQTEADFLMSCLMSPPLPAAAHSLPSLRLSPLQALLPLLPASLVSSSSCEIASLLPVCLVLCLRRQEVDGRAGGRAAALALRDAAEGARVRGAEVCDAAAEIVRDLEEAGRAATGAAQLLAVAAAAAAGARQPLPSLQQAMLGLPAPGEELADLLSRDDASRLSGLAPFELFQAAVVGATAASRLRPRSFLEYSMASTPSAAGAGDDRAARAFCLPLPLQRDWRCVVLGLPRRPSLEVGRLLRGGAGADAGALNLYSYLTASPPVFLLRHPLLVQPHASAASRDAGPGAASRRAYAAAVSASSLLLAPPHFNAPLAPPAAGPASAGGSTSDGATRALAVGSPGDAGAFASAVLGPVGGVMRLLPGSAPQGLSRPGGGAALAPSAAGGDAKGEASLAGAAARAGTGAQETAGVGLPPGAAGPHDGWQVGSRPGASTTGPGPLGALHGRSGAQATTSRGGVDDAARAGAAGGGSLQSGAQASARPGAGEGWASGSGGVAGPATTGCGVVLCAVPGVADMAKWRPKGQLVGMLLAQELTGARLVDGASWSGDGGKRARRELKKKGAADCRVQLASTEDGRLLVTGCMETAEGQIAAWGCADLVRHGRAYPLATWAVPSPLSATTLKFLHNARALAVGASDGSCRVYRVDGGGSTLSAYSRTPPSSAAGGAGGAADLLLTLPSPAFPLFSPSSLSSSLVLRLQMPRRGASASAPSHRLPEERFLFRTLLPASLQSPSPFFSAWRPSLGSLSLASLSRTPSYEALLAASAARAAGAAAAGVRGVVGIDHFDSCFEQLLFFLLENGHIGGYDLRASSSPVFSAAALPPWWGLPTAQSVSSDGKFVCLGTAGGVILLFDLRLLLPLQAWRMRQRRNFGEDEEASDRPAPVILQLRPCPLHLLRSDRRKPWASPHRPARNAPLAAAVSAPGGAPAQGSGAESEAKAGKSAADAASAAPDSCLAPVSSFATQTSGAAHAEFLLHDQQEGASGAGRTRDCLFLALLGGDAGAAVVLDVEAGQVVATFSSSCFPAAEGCAFEDGDFEEEGAWNGSNPECVDAEEAFGGTRRHESYETARGDFAPSCVESWAAEDGAMCSPLYWLEALPLASLLSPPVRAPVSPAGLEAGLAATALSPHCPRCLFVPPALRGPPTFFLTAGNDRCIRYWGLEDLALSYLGDKRGERRHAEMSLFRASLGSAGDSNQLADYTNQLADYSSQLAGSVVFRRRRGADAYVVAAPEDSCAHRGTEGRDSDGLRLGTQASGGDTASLFTYEILEEDLFIHLNSEEGATADAHTVVHVQEICRRHGPRYALRPATAGPERRSRRPPAGDGEKAGRAQDRAGEEGPRSGAHVSGERGDGLSERDAQGASSALGRPRRLSRGMFSDVCGTSEGESDGPGGSRRSSLFTPKAGARPRCCCCQPAGGSSCRSVGRAGADAHSAWFDSEFSLSGEEKESHVALGHTGREDLLRDAGPKPPSVQHRDAILDLAFVELQQQLLLVSSGRDGVVKIWR
ncbi:hypothetical protein BESB_071670, partial [Besnoitia besnoiti]